MHKMLWDTHSVKEFYPSVSRDTTMSGSSLDEEKKPLPSKPSPEPIFHICNVWGCSPEQVIMVGDSAADDITAAYRANCGGRVLLRYNGKELDNDAGGGGGVGRKGVTEKERQEREPTLVIENLGQLLEILKRNQN
jgi:phosphoglycolate phosphatase-like HAD superfamily hydrolase